LQQGNASSRGGALPEKLIEAELFGLEKGAYTGADRSHPARFEIAKGCTLFLDEIGELSASAQVKLLRVLQSGEFERIGDTRARRAEVRILAATNRNLAERMKEGEFRPDLFFRMNSFPITLPPLRERREDILPLAAHFIEKYARARERRIKQRKHCSPYHWQGNIRELENVVERSVTSLNPAARLIFSSSTMDRRSRRTSASCCGGNHVNQRRRYR
jgi:transcriptional regulator with GAF, ATPase, and Fis domain